MTIKLSNGTVVKWVGADITKPETWSSIKLAADIDYLAFISLWDMGLITSSTYVWSATHCIEKYCKSLLLKNDSSISLKSYSHNIEKSWIDCKQHFNLGKNERLSLKGQLVPTVLFSFK